MRASTAASARATTRRTSPRIAPAWRPRSASRRTAFSPPTRSTRRRRRRRGAVDDENRPRADAIVTRVRALAIGVTTADCGPVLFADPQARVIGAAHAGWRGAFTGVIEATVAAMEEARRRARPNPRRARADDPAAQLRGRPRSRSRALPPRIAPAAGSSRRPPRAGHALFDLAGYVAARLERAGVGQIEDLGLCTYADPDALFQLSPHHPSRRARLRPPRQCDCAGM